MKKIIVFDLDGTLAENQILTNLTHNAVMRNLSLLPIYGTQYY